MRSDRFSIPQILEFYAATEGNVSFFNVEGKPGAVAVSRFSRHRSGPRCECSTSTPASPFGMRGFCVAARPASRKALADCRRFNQCRRRGSRLYQQGASEQKILRDVFDRDACFAPAT